jgi:hypothetical protein
MCKCTTLVQWLQLYIKYIARARGGGQVCGRAGAPGTRVSLEVYRSGTKWIEVEVGTEVFRSGTDWEHF